MSSAQKVLSLPAFAHFDALPDLDSAEFDLLLKNLTAEFELTAAEFDRSGEFPHRNFERLHELGLVALTVPKTLGGSGATIAQAAKVIHAVARAEPSTALVLVMQYMFQALLPLNQSWPKHLLQRVATDAVQDGALINALRVEPELGTPARGGLPLTTATRVEGGWLLNGRKLYSTGIPRLTWMTVWARSSDEIPLVGGWLVHRDTPGIKIIENWDHLGMRASGSHEVVFENVWIPEDHAVDVQRVGDRPPPDSGFLKWSSILLPTLYDAIAHAARDWFVQWATERVPSNLGASLSTVPRFQEALGEVDAWLFANQAVLHSGAHAPSIVSNENFIKFIVTSNAIQAVQHIIELTGNPGLSRHNPLERHLRNVLCSRIHTPQNDAILIQAGQGAFKKYALGTT